jgi:hypothetical protein
MLLHTIFRLEPSPTTRLSAARNLPGNFSGLLIFAVKKVCLLVNAPSFQTISQSYLSKNAVPAAPLAQSF